MHQDTNPVQTLREHIADRVQEVADKDTQFRFDIAHDVGQLVAETDPCWPTAAAVASGIGSDKTDGLWAKLARVIRGYDVATDGGELDPVADHKFMEAVFSGLLSRCTRLGDIKTQTRLAANLKRLEIRNAKMDENRARIKEFQLDKKEMRANRDNKNKMVYHCFGVLALASPLANNRVGRWMGLKLIESGTKRGERGERTFRQKVDALIAQHVGTAAISTELELS